MKRILILGGGELGQGLARAFAQKDCHVVVADRYQGAPAMRYAHASHVVDLADYAAVSELIAHVQPQYMAVEIEGVNMAAVKDAYRSGVNIIPSMHALETAMEREQLRRLAAEELGLPTTEYAFAETPAQLAEAAERLGYPCLVKAMVSSSGHGMARVDNAGDVPQAWAQAVKGLIIEKQKVMIEKEVDIDYELTVLCVRHKDGITLCQPIRHQQINGNFVTSCQPADIPESVLAKANAIATTIAEALGGFGVYGVELFVKGDDVLFNEVSPRPHDTAMVTLATQGAYNQFELCVRAALSMPIPDNIESRPGASRAIVAKGYGTEIKLAGIDEAKAIDGVRVHTFIKPSVAGQRRIGLVTAVADSVGEAQMLADEAYSRLSVSVSESVEA